MQDIIIRPRNKKEKETLKNLLDQLKVNYILSNTEKEDQALLKAMKETGEETSKPIEELYDLMGWK